MNVSVDFVDDEDTKEEVKIHHAGMEHPHPVTGLPNITALYNLFRGEIQHSANTWGLVVFDVAATRAMNETFGYRGTDILLIELGKVLSGCAAEHKHNVFHLHDEKFASLIKLGTSGTGMQMMQEFVGNVLRDVKEARVYRRVRDQIAEMYTDRPIPYDMILTLRTGICIWQKNRNIRKFLDDGFAALRLAKVKEVAVGQKTLHPRELGNGLCQYIRKAKLSVEMMKVKRLVEEGADLNYQSMNTLQRTPLMWAMYVQHRPLVKYLIKQHFDSLLLDESSNSYLMLSLKLHTFHNLADMFLHKRFNPEQKNDEDENALFLAIKNHQFTVVEVLINAHVNRHLSLDQCTATDHGGMSPLKEAIYQNQVNLVDTLLKAKANPNESGGTSTPLQLAAYFGRRACARLLLKAGADPNVATDTVKETPLMLAAYSGMSKKIEGICPEEMRWGQEILAELGRERYRVYGDIIHELCVSDKCDLTALNDMNNPFLHLVSCGNVDAADRLHMNGCKVPESFEEVCVAPGTRRLKRFRFYFEIKGSGCVYLAFRLVSELLGCLLVPFVMVPLFVYTSRDWRVRENLQFHMAALCTFLCLGWLPGSVYAFLLGWYSPDLFTMVKQENVSGTRPFLMAMFGLCFVNALVLVWPWTFFYDWHCFLCGAITSAGILMPFFARRVHIMAIGLVIALLSVIPWAFILSGEEAEYILPIFIFVLGIPCFYMIPLLTWGSCCASTALWNKDSQSHGAVPSGRRNSFIVRMNSSHTIGESIAESATQI